MDCKRAARSLAEDLTVAFREAIEAASLNHRLHAHRETIPSVPKATEQLKKHQATIEARLESARRRADELGVCLVEGGEDRDAIFEEVEQLEEKHDEEVEKLDQRVDVVEEELGIEGE